MRGITISTCWFPNLLAPAAARQLANFAPTLPGEHFNFPSSVRGYRNRVRKRPLLHRGITCIQLRKKPINTSLKASLNDDLKKVTFSGCTLPTALIHLSTCLSSTSSLSPNFPPSLTTSFQSTTRTTPGYFSPTCHLTNRSSALSFNEASSPAVEPVGMRRRRLWRANYGSPLSLPLINADFNFVFSFCLVFGSPHRHCQQSSSIYASHPPSPPPFSHPVPPTRNPVSSRPSLNPLCLLCPFTHPSTWFMSHHLTLPSSVFHATRKSEVPMHLYNPLSHPHNLRDSYKGMVAWW